jgi:hypothetical protein
MSTPRISHFWRYDASSSQRDDLVMAARHEVRAKLTRVRRSFRDPIQSTNLVLELHRPLP